MTEDELIVMAHYQFAHSLRAITRAALTYDSARKRHERAVHEAQAALAVRDCAYRLVDRLPAKHGMVEAAEAQYAERDTALKETLDWLAQATDHLFELTAEHVGDVLEALDDPDAEGEWVPSPDRQLIDASPLGVSHGMFVARLRARADHATTLKH